MVDPVSHIAVDPSCPQNYMADDGSEMDLEDIYTAEELHAAGCFMAALSELGYGYAWRTLDAQFTGVPQRRRRVFVVGHLGDWRRAAAVLFERHSLQGHPAPSRQAGKGFAQGVEFGPSGGGFTDLNPTLDTRAKDGPVRNQLAGAVMDVMPTMDQRAGRSGANSFATSGGLVPVPHAQISPALKARDGKGPSSDGDGDGAILVPMSYGIRTANTSSNGWGIQEEATHTLDGAMGVAVATLLGGIDYENNGHTADEPTGPLLKGSPTGGGRPLPAIAFSGDIARTLQARHDSSPCADRGMDVVAQQMQVRRLTPTECERLQGFPNITETIRVEICFDRQKSVANVAIQCRKSQSSASNAGASESHQPANTAERHSSTSQACQEPLVALHVRQQSEGRTLELRNAQKLIMSASTAGKQNVSPLCMQAESFAATLVRIQQTLALTTSIGRVASHPSISLSLTEQSGNQSAETSGGATEECANDATPDASKAKFTISSLGHVTVSCDSPIATLLCSVMTATSGFIQSETLPETFSVELTTEAGYTNVPHRGKPAADGPRYKALGNSWAVPSVRWIGRRIDLVAALMEEKQMEIAV